MERYYFTFGSWEKFPYQNTYLIIVAENDNSAIQAFRAKYPDVTKNCLNCSDYYDEAAWNNRVASYYTDRTPAEIIWTETCFGQKTEGYDDVYIFVPKTGQIIGITAGSGDNLLPEDMEDGYVDYINFEQYDLQNLMYGMPQIDSGQILLKDMMRDKYKCLADCIPEVLDMAYGDPLTDCMILSAK